MRLTRAAGEALLQQLKTYLGEAPQGARIAQSGVTQQHDAALQSSGGGVVESDTWHISLRFGHDVLKNGMDPLSFIRYLATLGEIVSVTTLADAMPPAEQMDPECCYLGFELDFKTGADKATIEGVFEFVRDDCEIRILPPISMIAQFVQQILDHPDEVLPLGAMLVKCGSVTQKELDDMLMCQALRATAAEIAPAGEEVPPVPPLGEILVQEGMVQKELVDAALGKQKQAQG